MAGYRKRVLPGVLAGERFRLRSGCSRALRIARRWPRRYRGWLPRARAALGWLALAISAASRLTHR